MSPSIVFAVLVGAVAIPAVAQADLADDVRVLKMHLKVQQTYDPDTRVELALGPDETARLSFTQNAAGVTEFLFHNDGAQLTVIYACAGESYSSTRVTPNRVRDQRTVAAGDATEWMQCTTECAFRDGAAHVRFWTETIAAEQVRQIKEDRRKARAAKMDQLRRVLTWDEMADVSAFRMEIPGPDDPSLQRLRREYQLEQVVAGGASDYERLQRIVKWTHDRWKHSGSNTPSKPDPLTILDEAKQGKRFRCVEYARVVTGCAQALGMPARVLALKRDDVETATSGAGHVVAEIWLASLQKWVFADGQSDAIPELDGRPLNAVEFQDAIARQLPGLKIRSSSGIAEDAYLYWVTPYLYYFDFALNQRLFGADADHAEAHRRTPKHGQIMLVPQGAPNPTVFQRESPIGNCTYISNPQAFYPNPTAR